jgi:mRNA guanylyltransferase
MAYNNGPTANGAMSGSGPITSIDQPGTPVTGQMLHDLRDDVARMLNRRRTSFPGAQPVSFTRRHLEHALLTDDYFVCEKSDGLRYLMYLSSDLDGYESIYLIDRKNTYWAISTHHLHLPRPDNPHAFHTRTLLDGELVIDLPPGGAPPQPKFLVFDCAILDGEPLMNKAFDKRLARLTMAIIQPYQRLCAHEPARRARQPFSLELKQLQSAYNAWQVFRQIEQGELLHKNDGLIFTSRRATYKFGTDDEILKWKPVDENSIDCRLRLLIPEIPAERSPTGRPCPDYTVQPRGELWIFIGLARGTGLPQYQSFAEVTILADEWARMVATGDPLDNRIVECYVDNQRRWRILRFRDDKLEANHLSVLDSVLESIQDAVKKEDIVNAREAIRAAWKRREAMQQHREQQEREAQERTYPRKMARLLD